MEHTYISEIHLKGYKSIKNTSVVFRSGLNIIIGVNGGGKTNLLEVLYNFSYNGYNHLFQNGGIKPKNLNAILKYEGVSKKNMSISLDNKGKINTWEIDGKDMFVPNVFFDTSFIQSPEMSFPNIAYLRYGLPIFLETFSNPTNIELEIKPNIKEEDGDECININMEAWFKKQYALNYNRFIDNLIRTNIQSEKQEHGIFETNKKFISVLRQYTPVEDMELDKSIFKSVPKNSNDDDPFSYKFEGVNYRFKVKNEWFSWNDLSDGTKRILYIIGTIYYSWDSIILIEEPELGIHPHQLRDLMQFIKIQAKNKQIILTTHSPQVLNVLNSDELDRIIIAEMSENNTTLRHLDKKQQSNARKYMATELSLGDYWTSADLEPQNMML